MNTIFMERALELAKKAIGKTSPNPCVGAVIEKGGQIVGEGYHKKAGMNHAEMVAINEVMKKSGIKIMDIDPALFKNATLYVTLEPCCHIGKTGSCADIIVKAGFKKVCIGMKDPFAKVNGNGIKILKKHGIDVEVLNYDSPIAQKIREINQPFIKWSLTGLPYVTLKAGMSLDGKIATRTGMSKWITNLAARKNAKAERSINDAVLTGYNTVCQDNCELKPLNKSKKLMRVIIDNKLSLDTSFKVFNDENVLIATTGQASKKNMEKFKKAGIKFKKFGKDSVSIFKLLKFLGENAVQSVFVEGGGNINGTFYDAFLKNNSIIDRVLFYYAPIIIGGSDALSVVEKEGISNLKKALVLNMANVENIDNNIKIDAFYNFY